MFYRVKVHEYFALYNSCADHFKRYVAELIVYAVHLRGGRFLDSQGTVMTESKAVKKTMKALKDLRKTHGRRAPENLPPRLAKMLAVSQKEADSKTAAARNLMHLQHQHQHQQTHPARFHSWATGNGPYFPQNEDSLASRVENTYNFDSPNIMVVSPTPEDGHVASTTTSSDNTLVPCDFWTTTEGFKTEHIESGSVFFDKQEDQVGESQDLTLKDDPYEPLPLEEADSHFVWHGDDDANSVEHYCVGLAAETALANMATV